ncbi:MAG: cobalamin-dependent protein [Lachnospiraceae bacterium]|nr:cobalamin-dependent protein [Lachnospiraceae bacterium]
MSAEMDNVKELVVKGRLKKIEPAVQAALDAGASAQEVLDIMGVAMDEVGLKFQTNEIFISEMLAAAKTMQRGVGVLKPLLGGGGTAKLGKFIMGTVAGDLHDIGKNLVEMMIEASGFEVIDLGVDVPAENFVQALRDNPDCKIIGVSALLTTTLDAMKETVEAIKESGIDVTIMVGGAPVTPAFAEEIGADVYTPDAGSAAEKAKEIAAALA